MSSVVDEIDLALLSALREDGRQSVTQLSQHLHLSRSAVHQRLERLRSDGVLRGFSPVIDSGRLGLGVSAIVMLSAGPGANFRSGPVRDQVLALPHVEYAAFVTGDADMILHVRVRSLEELRTFLLDEMPRLPDLRGTLTLLVLEEMVRKPFLLPGE